MNLAIEKVLSEYLESWPNEGITYQLHFIKINRDKMHKIKLIGLSSSELVLEEKNVDLWQFATFWPSGLTT